MKDPLPDLLQVCLEALEQGEPLEAILARHESYERDLRPLLEAVAEARESVPAREVRAAQRRSRASLLARAQTLRANQPAGLPLWGLLQRITVGAALATLMLAISGFGLAAVSAQSLPGDRLYSVKRTAEEISLRLAGDQPSRVALAVRYDGRRLEEVRQLLSLGRQQAVRFEGRLTTRGGDLWHIEGIPVLVTSEATIKGDYDLGSFVEIQGLVQPDGWVLAHRIRSSGYRFTGTIERAGDGLWRVGGQDLLVLAESQVEEGLAEGDQASVTVRLKEGSAVVGSLQRLPTATEESDASPPAHTPAPRLPTATAQLPATPTATPSKKVEGGELGEKIEFSGQVQSRTGDRWQVAGRWLTITADTEIDGEVVVGSQVRVEAISASGGALVAEEIELIEPEGTPTLQGSKTPTPTANGEDDEEEEEQEGPDQGEEVRFSGTIESISADHWVIGGQTVYVDGDTDIEDDLQVGDPAKVRADRRSDGTLLATKIDEDD